MAIIHDFKSIARKVNRQEQKAEFEEKNPKVEPSMYGWPYGVAVPFVSRALPIEDLQMIRAQVKFGTFKI